MDTQVSLDRVGPQELSSLQAISIATFRETFAGSNSAEDMAQYLEQQFSPGRLEKEYADPESRFYFARAGGDIAGYLKVNTGAAQTEARDVPALEIERIYVLAAFQGYGFGRLLLERAFSDARAQGLEEVWLGVWEHNRKAIGFYERYGFVVFGQHTFVLGSDAQTDLMMTCKINKM